MVKRGKARVRFTKANAEQCLILGLSLHISALVATSGSAVQDGHNTGRQTALIQQLEICTRNCTIIWEQEEQTYVSSKL